MLLKDLAASGALAGSLVSIDAMGCQSNIAETIVDLGGDYLLAAKDNQKTAHAEIQLYFDAAPAHEIDALAEVEKAHGRIETRRHPVSQCVDWMSGKRRYRDEPRMASFRNRACSLGGLAKMSLIALLPRIEAAFVVCHHMARIRMTVVGADLSFRRFITSRILLGSIFGYRHGCR